MKTCRGCGLSKPLDAFSSEGRVHDGRKSRCKVCLAQQAHGREAYFREHYRKNRERRLAWMRDHYDKAGWRRRKRTDPRVRLDDAMGMQVYHAIRGRKGGRRWQTILGYAVDDLMARLSARFKPGMTWENYGQWHVDHIVPKAAFAYTKETDAAFRACWALSNLQPLWATENMRKQAKVS